MGAAKAAQPKKGLKEEESDEDKELQCELKLLVDKITGTDSKLVPPAIEMLKYLIRTSTTSMTSVPKPLKYLTPYYDLLKASHMKSTNLDIKKSLADVISILAMGTAGGEEAKANRECLKYCLLGTMKNIGDWGHEYIRQLEKEIVQQWPHNCETSTTMLMPLINDILSFNCTHHAEIQACDLLMEIDLLAMLPEYMSRDTYERMCMYLSSCSKYVDDVERGKIIRLICEQYLRFNEYTKCLITALQMKDDEMVKKIFESCKDKETLYQLAFICSRHVYPVELDPEMESYDELSNILSNIHLNSYFLTLGRELDIMEPKAPEDIYKTWLEPVPPRITVLGEHLDSARQNLASSLVNGFANAGFGSDKLLTVDGGNKWIYRNKEHGMLSATASLGLLHLWDVDGGLTPIDKYLYSTEDYIKSGALLALGIVNCRLKSAYARLSGLGLALCYMGSRDAIHVPNEAVSILEEPFKSIMETILLMCGYAGTGDVLIIQKLLHIVGDKVDIPKEDKNKSEKKGIKNKMDSFTKIKVPKKPEWDYSIGQAMATLAVAAVSMGEEIGAEMTQRIFGHVGRYGDPCVRILN
ncbi:unnamed protein product [Acanthoscelides obtectus]|uniref:RPN1 N-terminal domain-containing protein n=1 Tax=Acanthoscelides obtectus TaxID=200917 RepID=A0A9P0KHN5_ACAOB|nr:unnamed protein product [Acanthoscelides obtectus]CAK1632542.1 26S proteasome non-ATPase regulatory subunit 2 [Acanthoscelides obtectus]